MKIGITIYLKKGGKLMEEYFWVRGTKGNGAPWDSAILFTCKEAAIIHAEFQKITKDFKEIHIEKITATEEVWKKEN